jgi:hypothetical protein
MKRMFKMRTIGLIAFPLSLVACGAAGPASGDGDLGTATVAITTVPAGVQCVQIVAQGSKTVERLYTVTANQSSILQMDRLPTGQVQFSGAAYTAACTAALSGQTAAYVADAVSALVQNGQPVQVALKMKTNGRASISVDFEAACVPQGASCAGGAACCAGLGCDAASMACTPVSTGCGGAGDSCAGGAGCCAGLACDAATLVCSSGSVECAAAGASCGGSVACCAGLTCADLFGTGVGACTAPICAQVGQACTGNATCCAGLTCFDASGTGVGACTASPPICAPAGANCIEIACCGSLQCADLTGIGVSTCN